MLFTISKNASILDVSVLQFSHFGFRLKSPILTLKIELHFQQCVSCPMILSSVTVDGQFAQ